MSQKAQIQALQAQEDEVPETIYVIDFADPDLENLDQLPADAILQVSMHATMGIGGVKNGFILTLKVGNTTATTLVDNGTTSTFVSPEMATQLPVTPTSTPKVRVAVESGEDKKKFWDAPDMNISRSMKVISGINECVSLFQWARSAISSLRSRWSGTEEQTLQDEVLHLQSGLLRLRDTLPAMHILMDRAEWRIHEQCVATFLPKLRDAVYDADDLLDEFGWYELKVAVEGNASQSPFVDFFNSVIQGSFNKVKDIQKRLKNLSKQLERMGLREATLQFNKSVRPDTGSLPDETKIFGRDLELYLQILAGLISNAREQVL
ncbi:Disease resistance protein RGA2 [Hordeum vulgare]|nr:Disease resistance protein RGA2 [Hordeum vulgare]